MAELSSMSQSSLLLPQFQSHMTTNRWHPGVVCSRGFTAASYCRPVSISRGLSGHPVLFPMAHTQCQRNSCSWGGIGVVSDSKSSNLIIEMAKEKVDFEPDIGGGGGSSGEGSGKDRGGGGGGSGGGGGGGGDQNDTGDDQGSGESNGKNKNAGKMGNALSMSQKLTLGYAALVGFGGLMGYLKSGSQKSLAAGGLSALLLYYVYTQLPTKPVFASSIGVGLSAALLVVMGSRFKKSLKIFPAGIVSLVSLVMTAGYLHGIMRSVH
ncbi:hypothetical protein Ancab_012852 [Ancistrocladus abbreviatus]